MRTHRGATLFAGAFLVVTGCAGLEFHSSLGASPGTTAPAAPEAAPPGTDPSASAPEPYECARARAASGQRNRREAAIFQSRCDAKKHELATRTPHPAPPPPHATAAASVSPATSASGRAGAVAPAEPTPTWIADLPTVEVVRAGFAGTEVDARLRRASAFEVLHRAVQKLTAKRSPQDPNPPSDAAARDREYFSEVSAQGLNAGSLPHIEALADSLAFQKEVLDRFLAPATEDAYWARVGPGAKERAEREYTAAKTFDKDAAEAKAAVKKGVDDANAKHVDLTVFGIKLGERVALPSCPTAESFANPPPVAEMCVNRAFGGGRIDGAALVDALAQLGGKFAITGNATAEAPHVVESSVRLPPQQCPSWVDCTLVVATKGGVALAVSFLTRLSANDADKVERHLVDKYHDANPDRSAMSKCTHTLNGVKIGEDVAPDRLWKLPGLNVIYVPYGSAFNCTQGFVRAELVGYRTMIQKAEKARDDAEPKM